MSTSTDLINSVKLRGGFPSSGSFTNANYLSLFNEEMKNSVLPLILRINEEYLLEYKDYSVTAQQSSYRMPQRAIGAMLRDVQLIDDNDNIQPLFRLFEEDKVSLNDNAQGYFIKGNKIVLSPTPTTTTGTLRLAYIRRPSSLVLTTSAGEITSIDTGLNQVVVSSLPSTMTVNTEIDFVQGSSPYDLLEMDSAITGVSGTTISFASLPDDLAVGDYIALSGESPVAQLPEELIQILTQSVLCSCLSSKKDKSVEFEMQKLTQMKEALTNMLVPRVKSGDKKIVAQGLLGFFR